MARRKFDPTRTTLLQAATVKVGPKRARGVVMLVVIWRDVRDELGRDITIAEFIRESGVAERTAFRWLTAFRQVFDGQKGLTPNDVLRVHDLAEFRKLAAATRLTSVV